MQSNTNIRRKNPLWVRMLEAPFRPIRENFVFFVCMFALGYLCTQLEITLHLRGAKPYELSVPELFFDLYILCFLLMWIPEKVRRWVRWIVAVLLYVIAAIDLFCYVRFESTLTPTMLMLAQETDSRETSEFLRSYVGWDILFTKVGWVVLIFVVHVFWSIIVTRYEVRGARCENILETKGIHVPRTSYLVPRIILSVLIVICLIFSYLDVCDNKASTIRLFSYDTIGEVEHDLTRRDAAKLYLPVWRMAFSLYANHLAGKQLDQVLAHSEEIRVDSCSFRTPNIVLIIGESYNRYHSQLYGYDKPTSPRQLQRAKDSTLVVFTDVVACWNLTSFAFKNFLSLHAIGDKGDWCDAPLFPEVFRKAGYHVTFLTNQFMSKAKEQVYDFSGGVFLNNPELSSRMFDERNEKLFRYDEGLLANGQRPTAISHQLIIYHLMGQHVDYVARFPKQQKKFTTTDYNRPDLDRQQLQCLADYDNATAYNDSVVDDIVKRYEKEDAVVIYMPDHGEECFNPPMKFHGRLHSTKIDSRLAREEFDIPFWIWCSEKNRELHPDIYAAVKAARTRPFMTDNLPHLLLGLAGIHVKGYRPGYDLLSPQYNSKRPRILKNQTDYDKL